MQKVSLNRSTSPRVFPSRRGAYRMRRKVLFLGQKRCCQTRWSVDKRGNVPRKSVADSDAIGDHIALLIADGFNVSNGEPTIVQLGLRLL